MEIKQNTWAVLVTQWISFSCSILLCDLMGVVWYEAVLWMGPRCDVSSAPCLPTRTNYAFIALLLNIQLQQASLTKIYQQFPLISSFEFPRIPIHFPHIQKLHFPCPKQRSKNKKLQWKISPLLVVQNTSESHWKLNFSTLVAKRGSFLENDQMSGHENL